MANQLRTSGVFNLGSLGGGDSKPTRKWGGLVGRQILTTGVGSGDDHPGLDQPGTRWSIQSDTYAVGTSASGNSALYLDMVPTSGKYYVEFYVWNNNNNTIFCGIQSNTIENGYPMSTPGIGYYSSNGQWVNGSGSFQGTGHHPGNFNAKVIGLAIDFDANKTWFHVEGVWANSGNPSSGGAGDSYSNTGTNMTAFVTGNQTSATKKYASINTGNNGTFDGYVTAGGYTDTNNVGNFKYAVPTGFQGWYTSFTAGATAVAKTGNLKLSELLQATYPTGAWDGTVEYLIVAGGGSGGGDNGGAGGGGGVLTGTSLQLTSGTGLTFQVGKGAVRNTGGPGSSGDNNPGTNGDNSRIGTLIAYGGGGGGCGDTGELNGLNGGTGGGGGSESGKGNGSGGTGTSGQGYAGGGGLYYAGGGGGGAGEAGTSPTASNAPGNGGDGVQSSITGTATYYGGGGGGGTENNQTAVSGSALGGQGGGGQGGLGSTPDDGTDHLGGGGGGAGYQSSPAGSYPGKGGSGVVIVKFPSNSGYTLSQFQGEFNNTTGLSFTDHGNGAYEVRLSNTGNTVSKTWTPNF